jgi:hypothetical protein
MDNAKKTQLQGCVKGCGVMILAMVALFALSYYFLSGGRKKTAEELHNMAHAACAQHLRERGCEILEYHIITDGNIPITEAGNARVWVDHARCSYETLQFRGGGRDTQYWCHVEISDGRKAYFAGGSFVSMPR